MRRRTFLAACGAGVIALRSSGPAFARRHPKPSRSDLVRVKLFSGVALAGLEVASDGQLAIAKAGASFPASNVLVDLATGTATADGRRIDLAGEAVAVSSATPLLLVAHSRSTPIRRRYAGSIELRYDGKSLLVVNAVDVETYVASILSSEIPAAWPAEALEAQAIATRTYALHAQALGGARNPYDLTDDTSSQVYRGSDGVPAPLVRAAVATTGLIVRSGGEPAEVFYSSTCGGHTASAAELTGREAPPHLRGIADTDASGRAYCARAPYFSWRNTIVADALGRVFNEPKRDVRALAVEERWPDGRVKKLRAELSRGEAVTMDGRIFYNRASSLLGYKVVPSTLFEVFADSGGFRFVGHGVGHGVGLCQYGARGRAQAHMSAQAILAAYFPNTSIGPR